MLVSIPEIVLVLAAVVLILATLALAVQATAAICLSDRPPILSSHRPSIAVLMPAHNEEQYIEKALLRIKEDLLPTDRLLVVADNCIDHTAPLAARAGADIVARDDPTRRGKGFALAAGLRHLAATPPEVVIFIDADCQVSSRCVELLARACAAANAPVQCLDLMIANPDSEAPPHWAEFAWRIKNDLRPSGYARLGLPCHLLGTGMALPWRLIDPAIFATGHLSEDMLLGLDLAIMGSSPRFFRDVSVKSYFPASERGQAQQKQRWMHGHFALINSHVPRLFYQALKRRELSLLALAADLAVPPLGVLAVANFALLAMSLTLMAESQAIVPLTIAAIECALFAFFLGIAWHLCGRDVIGLKELRQLPRHIIMVLCSASNLVRGRRALWTRAERL